MKITSLVAAAVRREKRGDIRGVFPEHTCDLFVCVAVVHGHVVQPELLM